MNIAVADILMKIMHISTKDILMPGMTVPAAAAAVMDRKTITKIMNTTITVMKHAPVAAITIQKITNMITIITLTKNVIVTAITDPMIMDMNTTTALLMKNVPVAAITVPMIMNMNTTTTLTKNAPVAVTIITKTIQKMSRHVPDPTRILNAGIFRLPVMPKTVTVNCAIPT